MKKVAIVQSNYIPWKGYFDLIAAVDEFILYDDMQFTRRDWRNRNRIKTPQGLHWLTMPVLVKGRYFQTIRETEVQPGDWAEVHWKSLRANYAKAAHFAGAAPMIEGLYQEQFTTLSALNRRFMEAICFYLGITTKLSASWDYELGEGKSERLADLCRQAGADVYISGPTARDYLDESVFADAGIGVEWFDYAGYPEYPQLWGPFEHGVSILDLIFNCGRDARRYMRHVK
ncbi:MAG: WbqC family protein [Devosia nanyangense]|uniref:WbqC family protein n=1 Tax=Devosia nanyangense TaxID=1228055 RepID=A0A933L075_9HYPH|nr:WbqC family protein [Devosia nanyangense]